MSKIWRVLVASECTASAVLRARGETAEEAEKAALVLAEQAGPHGDLCFAIDDAGSWRPYIVDPGISTCLSEETEDQGEKVGSIDVALLEAQACTVGNLMDAATDPAVKEHLTGVRNGIHAILDACRRGGKEEKGWLVVH